MIFPPKLPFFCSQRWALLAKVTVFGPQKRHFWFHLGHHDDLHPGLRSLPAQPGVQPAQQLGHHRPQEEQQGAGDRGRPVWYRRPQRGRLSKSDEWARNQGQRHLADGFAPSTKGLYNARNNTVEQYKRPTYERLAFQKILRSFVWEDAETAGRTRPWNNTRSCIKNPDIDLSGQGWDLCGQKLSLRACRTLCLGKPELDKVPTSQGQPDCCLWHDVTQWTEIFYDISHQFHTSRDVSI